MKRIMTLLLLVAVFYAPLVAQKITTDKVPVLIYRSFKSRFPASNQEIWDKVSNAVYEVAFFNEKKRQTASFDTTGAWRETETDINFNQLPRAVSAAFNKQFEGFNIQETTEVEMADRGTLYSLIVNKGSQGYEVQFSAKGELLKKDAAKSED